MTLVWFMLPLIAMQWWINQFLAEPMGSDTLPVDADFDQILNAAYQDISIAATVAVVVFSVSRVFVLVSVYNTILQFPQARLGELIGGVVVSLCRSLLCVFLFWLLVAMVVGPIAVLSMIYLPVLLTFLFVVAIYLSLRLSFLPMAIVHKETLNPLLALRESFSYTNGKVLTILGLFVLFLIAILFASSVVSVVFSGVESALFAVGNLVDAVIQIHALALLNLTLFRLYLRSIEE